MKTKRTGAALAAAAIVVAGILTAHRAQAKISAPQPTAVAVAVSPASGHLFSVSEVLGKSWVSMLNAHSGRLLYAADVPTGTSQILVDDRSGHVFLTSRDVTVTLSTANGRIVSRLTWTSGNADMQALAGRLGFLYVTAGGRLHQIATRTGRELRSAPLSSFPFASVAVLEGSARVFTLDGAHTLRIYDARTLRLVRTTRINNAPPEATLAVAPALTVAEKPEAVLVLSGKTLQDVGVLDVAGGAVRRTFHVPIPVVDNIAVDPRTKHAFAVSFGVPAPFTTGGEQHPPISGAVTTVDIATGKILNTVQPGAMAAFSAVDPSTGHVFVLSRPPLSKENSVNFWSARVSMIDTRTGALLRPTTIPETAIAAARLAVDSTNHRVYLTWATSSGNSLTVLDSRTNKLLPRLFLASGSGG
jgi:DNA-binding beta-propeller fold protein YncE